MIRFLLLSRGGLKTHSLSTRSCYSNMKPPHTHALSQTSSRL